MRGLSLFSGIGGLDLAAEAAGIKTVAMCESADFPRKVLRKNWADVPIFEDVKKLSRKVLEEKGVISHNRKIDLMHGGFPCQPFSLVGEGRGEEDERYLWDEFDRLIGETKPKWVVGENVPGILNRGLERVVRDLERKEYKVWVYSMAAADVEAPHKRQRYIIVACNTDGESIVQENSETFSLGREWESWNCFAGESWEEFSNLHREVPEPGICRMDDGISKELDKNRLTALGNAVVPQ